MNAIEVAIRIAQRFDEDDIAYGIGGALALGVWGPPRATKDVDVTAFVPQDQLSRVLDSLERAGVMVNRADAARDVARIGLFKGRLGVVFVDVFMSSHPQYADMEQRRRRVTDPDGRSLWFISAEDLCIHKLVFARHKDLADLESLLAARPTLDVDYVRSWLVKMVPADDSRIAALDDLERRFASTE
jgi:hypothetical protein